MQVLETFFHEGVIDSRDIKDIAPFRDGVSVANVTEAKLVDWCKKVVETTYKTTGYKPGLMAVSGLNYTVDSKKGTLVGMNFVDKDGKEHKIDVENPSSDKKYKIAMDSFMMNYGADYDIMAPKEECIEYKECKDHFTCEYIKHLNKPIEINQTGRIRFV